jgi:hypothetical protein
MIDSVSNYCNRWCERCPFTDRCSLIAFSLAEEIAPLGEAIVPLPASFPAMSGRFSGFLERLDRQLKTFGSSLAAVGYGAERELPRPSGLHPSALEKLARQLSMMLLQLDEAAWMPDAHRNPDFSRDDVQALVELRWYQMMIGPKYRRTVREVSARNEHTDHDAAFTARLTHLVIVRAICGITVLLEAHGRAAYGDLRQSLEGNLRLLAGLRAQYPLAYSYRRPGFDDPGERRCMEAFYEGFLPVDPFEDGTWSPGGRAPDA